MILVRTDKSPLSVYKNPCFCGKEPGEYKTRSSDISESREFYSCKNNIKCKYFKYKDEKIFTYKDVINSPAQCLLNLERNKKSKLTMPKIHFEYMISRFEGCKVKHIDHITSNIQRSSPYCFESSSLKYAELWINTLVKTWRLSPSLWNINGIDIITDKELKCKIVPCLCLWSPEFDKFIDNDNGKVLSLTYNIEQKKEIMNSYALSDKNYIEWDKHWILLNGTLENNKGWLWNEEIDLILFEQENGFFSVKRSNLVELIKTIIPDCSLKYLRSNCVYDARDAYKKPFINLCHTSRFDYKLYLLKKDLEFIIENEYIY